ncbi:MAG: hypothetical protein AB7P22_15335 [Vicinamibacterales bacterium]
MDNRQLEAALGMTEGELLVALGRQLAEQDEHALPPSLAAARLRAEAWLRLHEQELQDAICTNHKIRRAATHSDGELAAAVLDVILGGFGQVAPITVAVLLTKRGVARYCEAFWTHAT